MAKKTAKLAITAPSIDSISKEQAKREAQYQLDDDVRSVRNYLDLRKDKSRHQRALGHMRKIADEADELDGRIRPRGKARQGRRQSVRNMGRR